VLDVLVVKDNMICCYGKD